MSKRPQNAQMTAASARLIEQLSAALDDPARLQELIDGQERSTVDRALLDLVAVAVGPEGILAKQAKLAQSRQPADEPSQNEAVDGLGEYWQTVNPQDKYTFPKERSKVLGKGMNGKVLAVTLKRDVAVKVVDVRGKSEDVIRYFLGEAEVMFLNESEFLMKSTECYWWNDKLFFIMPLMRFGSLGTLLAKFEKYGSKKKSVRESVWRYVAYAIFKALEDLHRDNRVHRDLKLDNVLIDSDGRVQLTDFGWSKKISPEDAACTVAGTYYTMAPEVAENYFLDQADQPLKAYGMSVDVRSAGVVLVEMATGEQEVFDPFIPDDICEQIRVGRYAEELRERVDNLSISEDFKELIVTCLEDDPAKRKTPTWLLENMAFLRDAHNRKPLQTLIKKLEDREKLAMPQKRQLRKSSGAPHMD